MLLGTGGLMAQGPRGGALFTLSLPVSRARLIGVRAATGLAELLVIALVSCLVLTLLSPAVGQSYSLVDALVHALCLFVAGTVLFSLATLLSTVFTRRVAPGADRPLRATMLAFCEAVFRDLSPYGLFGTMSGELYFRRGELPWLGLLASVLLSATFLFAVGQKHRTSGFLMPPAPRLRHASPRGREASSSVGVRPAATPEAESLRSRPRDSNAA